MKKGTKIAIIIFVIFDNMYFYKVASPTKQGPEPWGTNPPLSSISENLLKNKSNNSAILQKFNEYLQSIFKSAKTLD